MLYPVGDLDVGTQAKILPHKSAGPRGERGRADGPRRYGNRQGECVRPVAVSADQRGCKHRGIEAVLPSWGTWRSCRGLPLSFRMTQVLTGHPQFITVIISIILIFLTR